MEGNKLCCVWPEKIVSIDSIVINGGHICNQQQIANEFNNYFSCVGQAVIEDINSEVSKNKKRVEFAEVECLGTIFLKPVTECELNDIINGLRKNAAHGYDNIAVKDILYVYIQKD